MSRAPVRRPSAGGNSPARLEALAAGPVGIVARLVAVGLTHLFATGIRATTVNLAVSLRVG